MNNALPFVSVSVQPSYQHGSCVVAWKRSLEFEQHGVLVYRSLDGISNWQLLNQHDEPLVLQEQFLDETLPVNTKLDRVHYRLVLEDMTTGALTTGETLAFFERMSLQDYRTARRFMVAELQRLRTGAGVPAFLVMPRRQGVGAGVDAVTSQVIDSCTYNASGGDAAGFGTPLQTWVQLLGSTQVQQSAQDGTGTIELVETPARLPGFPQPIRGTLVVLPLTDDRYVVGDTVTPYAFRGLVPIAYQVTLARLGRQDPRYRVRIPRLDARLAQPAYTRSS